MRAKWGRAYIKRRPSTRVPYTCNGYQICWRNIHKNTRALPNFHLNARIARSDKIKRKPQILSHKKENACNDDHQQVAKSKVGTQSQIHQSACPHSLPTDPTWPEWQTKGCTQSNKTSAQQRQEDKACQAKGSDTHGFIICKGRLQLDDLWSLSRTCQ